MNIFFNFAIFYLDIFKGFNLKALVTGANGFIGSHIADRLHERGYEVRCMIRKTSNLQWLKDKPYELAVASLSDRSSLEKAVEGVDVIVHSAGLVVAKNYDGYLAANRDGTKNLLDAALNGVTGLKRFMYLSSQTAAGPSVSLKNPINEDSPLNPITSYGKSKKEAESVVMEYAKRLPASIIRPSAVYGPRDTEIYQYFVAVNKGLAAMVGFKPKYINLIHSDDLVRGIIDCMESPNTVGKSYFLASEKIYNWDMLTSLIKEIIGKKFCLKIKIPEPLVLGIAGISGLFGKFSSKPSTFNYEKGKDFVQDYWICSVERAKADFGFRQQISLEEGIESTIKWYREHGWL